MLRFSRTHNSYWLHNSPLLILITRLLYTCWLDWLRHWKKYKFIKVELTFSQRHALLSSFKKKLIRFHTIAWENLHLMPGRKEKIASVHAFTCSNHMSFINFVFLPPFPDLQSAPFFSPNQETHTFNNCKLTSFSREALYSIWWNDLNTSVWAPSIYAVYYLLFIIKKIVHKPKDMGPRGRSDLSTHLFPLWSRVPLTAMTFEFHDFSTLPN